MTQPESITGVTTRLWEFLDLLEIDAVTGFQDGPVTITRGRPDEGTDLDAGTMTLNLNNRDGRFSPRNPNGAYFGRIGRNTAIQVTVPCDAAGVRMRNSSSAVDDISSWVYADDTAQLDITGDIDVRIELTPDDWAPAAPQTLVADWANLAGDRGWIIRLGTGGTIQWIWSADGNSPVATVTSDPLPIAVTSHARGAVRVTFDVNNGSGGRTTRFFHAESVDGPWTEFDSVTAAGVTSIFAATTRTGIGATGQGSHIFTGDTGYAGVIHVIEIRDGIDGPVVARPDFRRRYTSQFQKLGGTTFGVADTTGIVWFIEGESEIERPDIRATMEVTRWPQRWDVSDRDVFVPIECAGVLRRLSSPGRPTDDVIRRFMHGDAAAAFRLGYWPLTDPEGASEAASTVAGFAMKANRVTSRPQFGRGELAHWLPNSALTGEQSGEIRAGVSGPVSGWSVDFMYRAPHPSEWEGTNVPQQFNVNVDDTGSTSRPEGIRWSCTIDPSSGGFIAITAVDNDTGATIATSSVDIGNLLDGNPHYLRMQMVEQSGTNGALFLDVDGVSVDSMVVSVLTTVTPSPRNVGVSWTVAGTETIPVNFGHISMWGPTPISVTQVNDVYHGYDGETAARRFIRLVGDEDGVAPVVYGDPDESSLMGPQRPITLLESVREAVTVDGGIMLEGRDSFTLALKTYRYLLNRDAALVLNYSAREVETPFHPDEDDQNTRNDVTTSWYGGDDISRVVEETGPLSIQTPPAGVGQYAEQLDVNVSSPSQLPGQAGLRVLRGSWNEARYPTLSVAIRYVEVNLLDPDLRDRTLIVDSGHRIDVTDLPSWLPPEDVRMLTEGYTETITPEDHGTVFNASPYGPFIIPLATSAVAVTGTPSGTGDPAVARVDTDGSTLAADVDVGTDTTMLVATQVGPVWSTDVAEYPAGFDVVLTEGLQQMAGAVLHVTAVTSPTADNFNRSVANPNWGSTSTGAVPWVSSGTVGGVTFSVNGSRGLINRSAGGNSYMSLGGGLNHEDVEVLIDIESSAASGFVGVVLRFGTPTGSDLADGYGVGVSGASGSLEIFDNVTGPSGGSTLLDSVDFGGWTTGTQWRLRARAAGSLISAKMWPVAQPEPLGWHLAVEDTTHSDGSVACQRVSTGEGRFDNLVITSPQLFTVAQQAVNGVVKVVPAGPVSTGVRLAVPTRPALP